MVAHAYSPSYWENKWEDLKMERTYLKNKLQAKKD
jgi:hypothetical protein